MSVSYTHLNEGERITVSGLCKRTGLSNSFFYRNEKIKEEVHKAVDIQNQSYKMNRQPRLTYPECVL